ncbi:lipopolysaccharide biosynthesis protein [Flaviaesturariibacter amylovorans]|uniref:Polysaccharide biosynthesis protein C-terminal domain-containing protein n=1 Tax=Flaviaesturariibacter amylovorans TaxID=1084520 RepID=A0ABP8GC30_9BACT
MLSKLKPFYIYTFTTFFTAGVSFVVFSFLTHSLNAADYGVINLYSAFCIFMTPFIGLGMQVMLGVDFFKLSEGDFKHQFVNAMALPLLATLGFTALFAVFHRQVEALLHVNTVFAVTFPLCCFMILVSDIFLVQLRNRGNHLGFAAVSIVKNLVEVSTTVLFIYFIPLAWKGRLLGSNAALLVSLLIAIYLVRRWRLMEGKFESSKLKANFRIGLPLVPERLAIFVFSFSDRFFIDHFSTVKDVGQYSAGAQISVIVRLMIVTLLTTFQPGILRELAREQINFAALRKINLQFIAVCLATMLGMLALTPLIFRFFIGAAFQEGQAYAFFLTLGMFFSGLQSMFMTYLLFLKKNKLLMVTSLVGVVTCCALNYVNVSYFGPIGATYTSVAVYALMSGITLYFVNQFYGLRKLLGGNPLRRQATPPPAGEPEPPRVKETAGGE